MNHPSLKVQSPGPKFGQKPDHNPRFQDPHRQCIGSGTGSFPNSDSTNAITKNMCNRDTESYKEGVLVEKSVEKSGDKSNAAYEEDDDDDYIKNTYL